MFKLLSTLVLATAVLAQKPTFNGKVLIQPGVDSAYCLTAANKDGAPAYMAPCDSAKHYSQAWKFSNGVVKIHGDKCLDVTDGKTTNGAKLQVWTCSDNGDPAQQFYYTPWGDNHLAWTDHGMCMDLTDGSLATGNQVQMWACGEANQVWNIGYYADSLPDTVQTGQSGLNNCDGLSTTDSVCQTAWINSAEDFCLWAPTTPTAIGESEAHVVAYCTSSSHGARVMPKKTLTGVHFVKTPDYVQVTGTGDFTKINVPKGDDGGELDPHGADGTGNPIGGLVYGKNNLQYHEWTSFISDSEFCIRACTGNNARALCQHIYDEMGCYWNMPANYDTGVFENCDGNNDLPMGVYGSSTWHQGVSPTPAAHPAAASSNCASVPSITPHA